MTKSGRCKVDDLTADGLKVDGLKVNNQNKAVNRGFWQSGRSKVNDPKSKVFKWTVFKWYVQRRRSKVDYAK